MKREIGSEFWINEIIEDSEVKTPNWLSKFGNVVLTSSGRAAITLLLQQLDTDFKTALLPSYICDSVIMPFIEMGYVCYFYDVEKDLSVNIDYILNFDNIGVFLHIGYFGFKTNSNLERVIKHFKVKSTVIVEDVTHTLFSNYDRFYENDFYVGSIRKWAGIPSGGFLASNIDVKNKPLHIHEEFTKIRKEALLLKHEYIKTHDLKLKEKFLNQFSEAEEILENDSSIYSIDEFSLHQLNNLNVQELIEKRRKNYAYLKDKLNDINLIEILFKDLDENICPMFFPILIKENRNQIRKFLIDEEIYCPVHWPIPKQINIDEYRNSYKIYNSVLSIPCDQRYDLKDMERIISVLKTIFE